MAKGSAKLKLAPVEVEPDPAREQLVQAFARVAELEAAVKAIEEEISEGHTKVREIEKLIAETSDRILNAHPSEKRRLRKALEEAREDLGDWQAHLETLKQKAGSPPFLDAQGSLSLELRMASGQINFARSAYLKQHPAAIAVFEKVKALRGELLAATADALMLAQVGGVPEGHEQWESIGMQARPAPNAAFAAWIKALAADPHAELET